MVAYLSVLYQFVDVTGQPLLLLGEAVVTLGAGTRLSSSLRARRAGALSVGLLVVGLGGYVASLPTRPPVMPLVVDAVTLLTGRSLLFVTNADMWVLGVAPAPLFLTWYLGLRRRYVSATLVGGATLGFLVLTGDAGSVTTLLGVVGGVVAVGIGDVERRDDDLGTAESLAVLLALMILIPAFATLVPGGPSQTISGVTGTEGPGTGAETVEASLVSADDQLGVQGNISLSPDVRFRVRSDRESYWQVGSYDRYTGDGWIRTGSTSDYDGNSLDPPPGPTGEVTQEYTMVDELGVLPAAWKPVDVSGDAVGSARLDSQSGFVVSGSLEPNETYTVESRVPVGDAERLRSAGADYPDAVRGRYTSVPSSTPDRLAERTERITANAENPYETARVVERWLKNNKEYSLDVERPENNVADTFLFEMDAGYCTYFATTMVTMLRSQEIPARLAVGYTPGERVDEDEWVVRGFNAHAWVQVYFPDNGWVRFDPTPGGPRDTARAERLQSARDSNRTDVDTRDTGGAEWTPAPTSTPAPLTPPPRREQAGGSGPVETVTPERRLTPGPDIGDSLSGANRTAGGTPNGSEAGGEGPGGLDLPSREETTLIGIAVFGLAVGVRRLGVTRRAYRAVWLRYQPRTEPANDAERAYERMEYLLGQRHRARKPGETSRQYLAAVDADERARTVARIRERARYSGEIAREEADEAVALVDELVPSVPGRL
jgi:transglutaminase-like putative cysteine protease